jgi:hypothetical protein
MDLKNLVAVFRRGQVHEKDLIEAAFAVEFQGQFNRANRAWEAVVLN